MTSAKVDAPFIVLAPADHRVLGEREFGGPGLLAIEAIGPFVEIQASGPLITVHDSTVEARLGIGHHPHRYNERLFYIEQGQLDHDDSMNQIKGHMDAGDVGLFTEGRRGMLHSEWNHGDVDTKAYILVYSTAPVPAEAAFTRLKDADAPRYDEGPGCLTKELVGKHSRLRVNGDIRLATDSTLQPGARLEVRTAAGEGGLLSVREGTVVLEGQSLPQGTTLVLPPADAERLVVLEATEATRVVRVVHGRGHGFIKADSPSR
jgi:redox-sensitive bicupin YhaK (pirin superfamily)